MGFKFGEFNGYKPTHLCAELARSLYMHRALPGAIALLLSRP